MELLGWILVFIVGSVLVFFLLSVGVFFALRRRVRQIGAALEATMSADMPRFRVSLEPLPDFEWHDEQASERAVTQLAAARFSEAGRFTLRESSSARLVGMANETDSLYAAVYELGGTGPHVDVVGRYDDGRRLTLTNVPDPGLDEPDDHITLRLPGADAATLVARARDERPPGTLVAVDLDDFGAEFEAAYAEEMDWRAGRGGFNRSEITHAAHIQAAALESDEIRVDDATVDLMLSTFNQALFSGVDETLRERLEGTTDLTVAEWEEVRDRLVFVYDNLPAKIMQSRLRACLPAADPTTVAGPGGDEHDVVDRESFAAALEAASAAHGGATATRLDAVDEPFAADVYVTPA